MTALVRVEDAAAFLASLDQAKAFLAACTSYSEAKSLYDQTSRSTRETPLWKAWAQAHGDAKEIARQAELLEARALRRMGELAPEKPEMAERGQGRKPKNQFPTGIDSAIDPKLLHKARAMADIPEEEFEAEMEKAEKPGAKVPSVSRLLQADRQRQVKEAHKARVEEDRSAGPRTYSSFDGLLAAIDGGREKKFQAIYADPPWAYANAKTRGAADNEYTLAPLDEIKAMPVPALAADNCFLFMWATSPLLPEAIEVIKAWGFLYRSSMVWDKHPRMGLGNYARIQHELLLIAIKGKPKWTRRDVRSVVRGDAGEHSVKPPAFRQLVTSVCEGPHVELFARTWTEGWAAMGNEISGQSSRVPEDLGMFSESAA